MNVPPALELVTGLIPFPDPPPGVTCWSGRLRDHPAVSVTVILDTEPVDALDPGFIDRICAGQERLLAVAARTAGLDDDETARWDPN
ncbi:MAG TPA: hypothetical protein VN408_09535 [Actinoplanes sp.]|nr:hypothetical protein [Actinoplanes sp.]